MATEPFLFGHMASSHTFSSINLALNRDTASNESFKCFMLNFATVYIQITVQERSVY